MDPLERFDIPTARWDNLIERVRGGNCVPIVGAQLSAGIVPVRDELARRWAEELEYPLAQNTELPMVAEYALTAAGDKPTLLEDFQKFVRRQRAEMVEAAKQPAGAGQLEGGVPLARRARPIVGAGWLDDPGHPLRTLAKLPFDTFLTTCYDGLLAEAIRTFRGGSEPVEVSCRWDPEDRDWNIHDDGAYDAPAEFLKPVIFHLHGRIDEPESVVLTETDHFAFMDRLMVNLNQNEDNRSLLPPTVSNALSGGTWFFIGYGAADRNLRALLRALGSQVRSHRQAVAVQLQHGEAIAGREQDADDFLTDYFKKLLGRDVEVVLHDVRDFLLAMLHQIEHPQQRTGTGS